MTRTTRVRNALAVAALLAAPALAQQKAVPVKLKPADPKPAPVAPSQSGGLIGQRVAFPNVLGRNTTPILQRRSSLPTYQTPRYDQRRDEPSEVGGPRYYYNDNGGVRIEGSYQDGDWSIDFHLGDPGWVRDGNYLYRYPAWGYNRGYYIHDGRVYYGRYNRGWYDYRYGSYYSTQPVDGLLTQRVDYTLRAPQVAMPQQTAPAEPAIELTALDKARIYMAYDQLDDAIQAFRDHLDEDPEDVQAMRALGIAMIENNRMEDGVAMIALAYTTDPQLARTPLDFVGLGIDSRRYDNLLSRVLQFARKVDSGSAHLVGAVLLQADGKVAGAGRVLDRAERAGLEEDILDPLRRELGIPAGRP